jgi:dinuclear metal center YbgI/SA1388 family protein
LTLLRKTMPLPLTNLIGTFESLWPLAGAEEWDRPGLTTGNSNQTITRALLCVDVTLEVLSEAKQLGCELVISHHPLLLKGVNFLSEDQLKGELVSFAVKNSIAVYSAHTNADIVVDGVSDILAQQLGLVSTKPLIATGDGIGHGRIGKLKSPQSLSDYAKFVSSCLPETNAPIRVAGDLNKMIETVAVVGGAGDSFIPAAAQSGADLFITSDLRHHVVLDAVSDPTNPLALIDISHFAAESLWLKPTQVTLSKLIPEVSFVVSSISTDPWTMSLQGRRNSEG